MRRILGKYDANKDGSLDSDELGVLLNDMNHFPVEWEPREHDPLDLPGTAGLGTHDALATLQGLYDTYDKLGQHRQ